MKRVFFLAFTLLFFSLVFAGEELIQVYSPKEPNITYFRAGEQTIIFFPPEDSSYNEISIVSSDFNVYPEKRTMPGDTTFYIKGDTSGIKNFTVTVSSPTDSYSYESSINISPTKVEVDGPYILTDFNFNKTYTEEQEIDFYCLGSRNHPTSCINQTTYLFDGQTYDFNYGNTIKFNFSGTKQITLYAKNTLGKETNKTFTLTINPPITETPTNDNPSTGGGSSGGSTGTRPPTQNNSTNNSNDNNTTESIVVDSNNLVTTNPTIQEDLKVNNENILYLNVENNNSDNNSVGQNISGLFTLPTLEGKNLIFITLIGVILLMGTALFLTRKRVVK